MKYLRLFTWYILTLMIMLSLTGCGTALSSSLSLQGFQHWLSSLSADENTATTQIQTAREGHSNFEISGQILDIILDQSGGQEADGIIVTAVALGTHFLLETADPLQRYLPSVQIVRCERTETCQVAAPQLSQHYSWNMLPLGPIPARTLMLTETGSTSVDALADFIAAESAAHNINLLVHADGLSSFDTIVYIYQTPATLTYLVLTGPQREQLLSLDYSRDEIPIVVFSTIMQALPDLSFNLVSMQPPADISPPAASGAVPQPTVITPPSITPPTEPLPLGVPETAPTDPQPNPPTAIPMGSIQTENWLATDLPDDWFDPLIAGIMDESALFTPPIPAEWQHSNNPQREETSESPQTDIPVASSSFPVLPLEILGDCPSTVHDRYYTVGPDGNSYRSWHALTVPIDPQFPEGPTCTFAHEHGDPPHADAPRPAFGYAALHANLNQQILDHTGYKVFTHIAGNQTGWHTPERHPIQPDWDMMVWLHMGTASPERITQQYHELCFWSRDNQDRISEIHLLADTGSAHNNCGAAPHPSRQLASNCNPQVETWHYHVKLPNWQASFQAIVLNPMTHLAENLPPDHSSTLLNTSEVGCNVSISNCSEQLPFGSAQSYWLGNSRVLLPGVARWQNAAGEQFSCSDSYGDSRPMDSCLYNDVGSLLQRISLHDERFEHAGVWDRSINALAEIGQGWMPQGAAGGN